MGNETLATIRLLLPYPDEDRFVSGYASFCRSGTLFLPTRRAFSMGERVLFELMSSDGARLMLGEGIIVPGTPVEGRVGISVRVVRLDNPSRRVYLRLKVLCATIGDAKEGMQSEPLLEQGGVGAVCLEGVASCSRDRGEPLQDERGPVAVVESHAAARSTESDGSSQARAEAESSLSRESSQDPAPDRPGGSAEEPRSDAELLAAEEDVAIHSSGDCLEGSPLDGPSEDAHGPHVLGIDIGTTWARAAVMDGREPRLLELEPGAHRLCSGVSSGPKDTLLSGSIALSRKVEQPDQAVFETKRLLGRSAHSPEVQRLLPRALFKLDFDEEGSPLVALARCRPSVTELTACVLTRLRQEAARVCGRTFRYAAIGVPAGFADCQRRAMLEAASLAGFEHVRLLNETVAAAVAHSVGKGLAAKRLLIVDVGSGFSETTLVTVSGDMIEVIDGSGELALGGSDVDAGLAEIILAKGMGELGLSGLSLHGRARVFVASEEAKIALGKEETHRVELRALWHEEMSGEPRDLDVELSREDLEVACFDLCYGLARMIGDMLERHRLSPDQIDEVISRGGLARFPPVSRTLGDLFGRRPYVEEDDDGNVALGCVLAGRASFAKRSSPLPEPEIKDVLSTALLLAVPGKHPLVVVDRGTPIPCERTIHVEVGEGRENGIELALFGAARERLDESEYLGVLTHPASDDPLREATLCLRFAVSEEGLVSVTSIDDGTTAPRHFVLSKAESPRDVLGRQGALGIGERDGKERKQSWARNDHKGGQGLFAVVKRRLFGGE